MKTVAPKLLEVIRQEVLDTTNTTLIEIGAGKAVVSRYLSKQFQWKRVIGVEGDWMTYWTAIFMIKLVGAKVNMVRRNIYKYQMPEGAKVIYNYMSVPIIQRMYDEGRLDGALVFNLTFRIQGVEPMKVIPIDTFQKELLVYDFRKKTKSNSSQPSVI